MLTLHRRTRITVGALGLAVAASPLGLAPAHALSSGTITFDGTRTGSSTPTNCKNANLDYTMQVSPTTDDDGSGNDWYVVTTVDGTGAVMDVDYWSAAVGAPVTEHDYTDFGSVHDITARPATVRLYDVAYDPSAIMPTENSDAAEQYTVAHGRLLSADTLDPASVPANAAACGSLPLQRNGALVGVTRTPLRVTRKSREVLSMSVTKPGYKQPVGTVVFTVTNGKRRLHHHRVPRVLSFTAPLSNGSASVTLPRLKKGGHAWTATYSGDTYTAPASQGGGFRVVRR